MSEEEKKEEKITFKIQGKEYTANKEGLYYKTSEKLSLKIGDIENTDIEVEKIECSDKNQPTFIYLKDGTQISFELCGVENRIVIKRIMFAGNLSPNMEKEIRYEGSWLVISGDGEQVRSLMICKPHIIRFGFYKGTHISINKRIRGIWFDDYHTTIAFLEPETLNFYIRDLEKTFRTKHIVLYNETRTINRIQLVDGIYEFFYYENKKYSLSFKSDESIVFDQQGNLLKNCISNERKMQIEEQNEMEKFKRRVDSLKSNQEVMLEGVEGLKEKTERETENLENKTNNLENKQAVVTDVDWFLIILYALIGFWFVFAAFGLCFYKFIFPLNFICPDNFDKMTFNFSNPEHETFNIYTFLYEILKRTPIIILTILGFKFLQLAFERLRLIGEVEQVRNYIALTADDDTKKELLKMIAIPFFAPKKVKSSFFDKLIEKVSLNIDATPNNQQRDGGRQIN